MATAGLAQGEIHVKYLSTNSVYLDSGSDIGLAIGDTLKVIEKKKLVATLEVAFVAEHSAACRILQSAGEIKIGAIVISSAIPHGSEKDAVPNEPDSLTLQEPQVIQTAEIPAKSKRGKIRGSLAISSYYWDDTGVSNLDFHRPGGRLYIRASELPGGSAFSLRLTGNYYDRNRSTSANVPLTEWRNRFLELNFGNYGDNKRFSFIIGRIIVNKLSGIGYIDGAVGQAKLSENLALGVFGGTKPDWRYSRFQTSTRKFGGYLGFSKYWLGDKRYDLTLAAAGEYHNSDVSREFLYLQNILNYGYNLNIFQRMELDINRGWRKDNTGKSIALSNFYLSVRRHITRWMSAGVSLDSRENYLTYELYTLSDSLFVENQRRGIRADLVFRPTRKDHASIGFGLFKRTTDPQPTYSFSAQYGRNGLFDPHIFGNLSLSGYSNLFSQGFNISARTGRYFRSRNVAGLAYNIYLYTIKSGSISRSNQSLQTFVQFDIVSAVYLSASYEYDFGDDVEGHRIRVESGYRF